MPEIKYLFVSTDGKISVPGPDYLDSPLLLDMENSHSRLTLKDYFKAMETFLFKKHADKFENAVGVLVGTDRPVPVGEMEKVTLCSVKIGAFYHIARVEVVFRGRKIMLALSAAFSSHGAECLMRDFSNIQALQSGPAGRYLPRVFFAGEAGYEDIPSVMSRFVMGLGEWLEDFHEWHFSVHPDTGRHVIVLWDGKARRHFLKPAQEEELFFQMAQILTLCFNPSTAQQVSQWHHAAGDFIVKVRTEHIETRLTTVRVYQPLFDYGQGDTDELFIMRLLFFFLDLGVRARMDRLDGIGEPVWADDRFIYPVIDGFFQGLKMHEKCGAVTGEQTDGFRAFLSAMSFDDLREVFTPLERLYKEENSLDRKLVTLNLEAHAENFYKALKDFLA